MGLCTKPLASTCVGWFCSEPRLQRMLGELQRGSTYRARIVVAVQTSWRNSAYQRKYGLQLGERRASYLLERN